MKHPLFDDGKPYSYREAWIWLIETARWAEGNVRNGNEVVFLKRGQLTAAYSFMATQWNWTKGRSKVFRLINKLKKERMIETSNEHEWLTITICNYNKYQLIPGFRETGNETQAEIRAKQDRNKRENNKNTRKISVNTSSNTLDDNRTVLDSEIRKNDASQVLANDVPSGCDEYTDPALYAILMESKMFPESEIKTRFRGCSFDQERETIIARTETQAETIRAKCETGLRCALGYYPEILCEKELNKQVS